MTVSPFSLKEKIFLKASRIFSVVPAYKACGGNKTGTAFSRVNINFKGDLVLFESIWIKVIIQWRAQQSAAH